MATTANASAADLRSASSKHGLSEAKQGANKKARTGGVGKAVAAPSTSSTPAPCSAAPMPCAASPMPWMAPAAAGAAQPEPGTSGAMLPTGNPGMVPPMGMPFFMPHAMGMGMMPPPMMAMQACMMMQMQMQAMQSMMQQQQQASADTQQQAPGISGKPSAAAAAAASLGYPGPLPCYPAFPFMPMGPPPMCFPHMPAPAPMQPQATPPAMQQQQAAAPAPCSHQRPPACSVAPSPAAPQPMQQQQQAQQPCAPVVPVDANATNLTDKDFAAFIDSFVSDGPADAQPMVSAPEFKQQQLIALGGGGSGRSSSGGSDSADDDFSFCLDDLLPLDAVSAQVESSLSSYSSMRPKAAASSRAPLLASGMDMLLHDDEEGGEESDLIFGLGCQVDDLLPTC